MFVCACPSTCTCVCSCVHVRVRARVPLTRLITGWKCRGVGTSCIWACPWRPTGVGERGRLGGGWISDEGGVPSMESSRAWSWAPSLPQSLTTSSRSHPFTAPSVRQGRHTLAERGTEGGGERGKRRRGRERRKERQGGGGRRDKEEREGSRDREEEEGETGRRERMDREEEEETERRDDREGGRGRVTDGRGKTDNPKCLS